jgi:hypothetical protein
VEEDGRLGRPRGDRVELDQQARISRLTTIWDGSLLDNAAITTLLAATIEQ